MENKITFLEDCENLTNATHLSIKSSQASIDIIMKAQAAVRDSGMFYGSIASTSLSTFNVEGLLENGSVDEDFYRNVVTPEILVFYNSIALRFDYKHVEGNIETDLFKINNIGVTDE